jgi:cytochrome P450
MYIAFICEVQITAIKKSLEGKHAEAENSQDSHPTIFHDLLENKDMPASEKSIDRLVQEGQIIVSAGTETTAWCLSVTTFHLLSNPQVIQKLRAELEGAMPKTLGNSNTSVARTTSLPHSMYSRRSKAVLWC